MIPKIIHYCWFGKNAMPERAKKCIDSWKKYCPDYKIVEWNENNFDIEYNDYTREAYEARKWAFISDVARLYALVQYGGIYMDTDVEVLRPLDDLLNYEAISGFESSSNISTGLMACEEGQSLINEFLHEYDYLHFTDKDGSYDTTTNVARITQFCLKYGFKKNNQKQTFNGFTLFPADYFCPKDHETKELHITNNTYTIHHFDGSWLTDEERYAIYLRGKYKGLFPYHLLCYVSTFIALIKYHGGAFALFTTVKLMKKKLEKNEKV